MNIYSINEVVMNLEEAVKLHNEAMVEDRKEDAQCHFVIADSLLINFNKMVRSGHIDSEDWTLPCRFKQGINGSIYVTPIK